jgi:hypothetical protein
METKHAPGPWKAIKAPHGPIDIFDCNDHDIVTLYGGNGVEAKEANARLIAAAPEMLKALREIIAVAEGKHLRPIMGIEAVRLAIAKATGE